MQQEELHSLITGCLKNDRKCQKMLYKTFYGFAMAICLRYAKDRDEATDVLNQGFLKVFTRLDTYDFERPFKGWLGRVMTNASIDNYRANLKMAYQEDLEAAEHISDGEVADARLTYNDLLTMVQQLPQAYRTVFNLFAIDGYSHEEIGDMLNITVGTSKSNLHKARQKLKQMLMDNEQGARTAGTSTRNYNDLGFSPIVAIRVINGSGDTYWGNGRRGF